MMENEMGSMLYNTEYAPYTYIDGMKEFIDIVSDMNREVEFV